MDTPRWIRVIGSWQLAGGGIAAASWLDLFRYLPPHRPDDDALLAVAVLIASLSAVAGYGLYKGHRAAYAPSLVVQGLQLVAFNLGTAAYQLALGPVVYVSVVWDERWSFHVGWLPSFAAHWNMSPPMPTAVAVNLLACFSFWKVLWWEPRAPARLALADVAGDGLVAPPAE